MNKKIFNISVLEPLIATGILRICRKDTLLCATFFPDDDDTFVSCHSDRGVKHLLVSLAAKIASTACPEVDLAYPYPVSIARPSRLLSLLQESLTIITHAEGVYKVRVEQHQVPAGENIAGRYVKSGEGSTLEKAFGAVINAHAELALY